MELTTSVFFLAAGLGILLLGAEGLVRGASSLARTFGISPLVVGLTVVAFGTSAPELAVTLYASLSGTSDLAVGNIVGSNIANILLILGLAAAIAPVAIAKSTRTWEMPFALLAALLLFILGSDVLREAGTSSVLSRSDGITLLLFFCAFLAYVYVLAKRQFVLESKTPHTGPVISAATMGAGLIGLVWGGKLLVDNAITLASLMGMSQTLIGLTVVAVGTSLPELATTLVAAYRKETAIAVGNIIGSNIFNIFWILGLAGVITPLAIPNEFLFDSLASVGAIGLLLVFLNIGTRGYLERWQGACMLILYFTYIVFRFSV